jgi:hypothetical protein
VLSETPFKDRHLSRSWLATSGGFDFGLPVCASFRVMADWFSVRSRNQPLADRLIVTWRPVAPAPPAMLQLCASENQRASFRSAVIHRPNNHRCLIGK